MKNIKIDEKFKRLLFLGDIHADFYYIRYLMRAYSLRNAVIVQVGDFGMGYYKNSEGEDLSSVNDDLVRRGCMLIALRGNHDDPSYFTNQYYKSNILLVEDYTTVSVNIKGLDQNILFIGGAISIDRVFSKVKGNPWFDGEKIEFRSDDSYLAGFKDIHYLVTHSAGSNVEPFKFNLLVYSYAQNDLSLLDELRNERIELGKIIDKIAANNRETLRRHFYGHFHFSATTENECLKHILLDVKELKEANIE